MSAGVPPQNGCALSSSRPASKSKPSRAISALAELLLPRGRERARSAGSAPASPPGAPGSRRPAAAARPRGGRTAARPGRRAGRAGARRAARRRRSRPERGAGHGARSRGPAGRPRSARGASMAKSDWARASRQVISQAVVARASASTRAGSSAWAWRYLRRISRRLACCQGSRSASSSAAGQLLAGLGVGQQVVRQALERRQLLAALAGGLPRHHHGRVPAEDRQRAVDAGDAAEAVLKRRVVPAHRHSPSMVGRRAPRRAAQRHSRQRDGGKGQHAHGLVQHGLQAGRLPAMTRAPRPICIDHQHGRERQPARDGPVRARDAAAPEQRTGGRGRSPPPARGG